MTLERPWLLMAVLLPMAWLAWEWRAGRLRPGLVLKALALAAILLAMAEPRLPFAETKTAVAVLVDTSASVSEQDLARASELVRAIDGARGRNWMAVIPFARSTRSLAAEERGRAHRFQMTKGDEGRASDLEAAVREAMAALPAGMVPRVALISDGRENQGSIARGAWQARQLGIPIDAFLLEGRPRPALRLESVGMPAQAFAGDRFPIDLVVTSPRKTRATVTLAAEGKQLGEQEVDLENGATRISLRPTLNEAGAIDLAGSVRAGGLGEVRFARSLTLRRPRLLYVSQDPPGTEQHLLNVLSAGQFDVVRAQEAEKTRLDEYQLVILNNWDLHAISDARKEALKEYTRQGGGLLVIAGERNNYVEAKQAEDQLEQALPAKLAPPRSPEGTCLILIVDKSSSMEGRKMELARLAAIGVIDNLRPIDLVGVLIFDNSFQWAVPIRKAEDRSLIKRLVAGITPDGGTQIAPALSEAYRRTLPVKATFKHIVLLTDGISEEGDSLALAKEAALQRVTISTVGLGQDVNRAYLEKVAALSKGKSHFLTDPSGLEQVLLRDVLEHTGSTAVEKPIVPGVTRQAEILEGVDMASAPALKGYVKFIAKPTAETILDIEKKDPLLVRWQYGLGRAAVFTSDAKSRWAESWIGWKGFDRFWLNVMRDLLPHAQAGEAAAVFDAANGDLVVEYRLARAAEEPKAVPSIFAAGPAGFQRPVEVRKAGEGLFRGRVHIGSRRGLFRVRPLVETRVFPEVGLYRQEEELTEYGANEALLRQIAVYTGGRFQPPASRVFDSGGRAIPGTLELWPGLLGLAILLNLAELVLRKWRGVFAPRARLGNAS